MRNARNARRAIVSVLVGVATVALVLLMPGLIGTSWLSVSGLLARLSIPVMAGLALVWISGLWSHSIVLAASLPGLTRRRGLMLNLTGSAVSNVLPLGGAAGTGLNFAMTRRWGFTSSAFAGFISVSTLVNVVAKLMVVAVALALAPVLHTAAALPAARTGLLLIPLLGALAAVAWLLASDSASARFGHWIDRLFGLFRTKRQSNLAAALPELRRSILRVLRNGWRPLGGGAVGYLVLQGVLLWCCFLALGAPLALPVLLTALAVERLLTLVPITPGGAGVIEVGTTATLVALGGDPASVAAGMLLYRGFTYLLEIPVGGTTLAIWLLRNRRRGGVAPAEAAAEPAV
ncbi:MAG TPA: lysylphosphatidylglycerol synthase transmembrane domain-containing protein [Kribbella sp.]|nr:lysylphosphatidylglycerol synthase transmembrane domain-containing protein [Kribbella sp.]